MTSLVNATGNQDIDGILWGWKLDSLNLTFSFPTGTAEYTGYQEIQGFSAFNATQEAAVRTILANVAGFCNLTFTESSNASADLRYAEASAINYTNNSNVGRHTGLHTIGTAEANPPELGYNGAAPYSPAFAQGDSWYNPTGYDNPVLGSFQFAAGIMHETGHNLGLKHGHVTQNGHGTLFPALPDNHDSYEYSVMTYREFPGANATDGDGAFDHPTTFMMDDIQALQYLYGANYSFNAGNTTYSWDPNTGQCFINGNGTGAPQSNFILMTVWDGCGADTYDFSNYTTNLNVDLTPGGWTTTSSAQLANLGDGGLGTGFHYARGNIANALQDINNPGETASLIENAVGGSGNDRIFGNVAANVLLGGGGADDLSGYEGNDYLSGGEGNDTLKGGGGADELHGGAGADTAQYVFSTGVNVNLATGIGHGGAAEGDLLFEIENLSGSDEADTLTGNNSANELYGQRGDDILKGGGGADLLNGGAGIDLAGYAEAISGVTVSLLTTIGSAGEALGDTFAGIENLFGSAFADRLSGDAAVNELNGWDGDDVLQGGGGADVLNGGAGFDTASYSLSGAGVYVDLALGQGSAGDALGDTYFFIENAQGSAFGDTLRGTIDDNVLSAGGGADFLYGGGGNDKLDGGAGADYMNGLWGDDIYYVDNEGDQIVEFDGSDLVIASVSYTTALGIERLYLNGALNINATGLDGQADYLGGSSGNNALDGKGGADLLFGYNGNDQLYGGSGLDQLYGGEGTDYLSGGSEDDYQSGGGASDVFFGGAGHDTMVGGAGDDEFYVQAGDGGDVIVEYVGEGNDRIFSEISYTLAANSEVETLSTTANSGSPNINLTGSDQANIVIGNNGSNILDGRGGNDTLYGLGGADYFTFSSAPSGGNKDVIADFTSADDLIFLDDAAFTGMAAGFLAAASFLSGAGAVTALTAAQRVIHNSTTGDLYYDSDGAGGAAAVGFANIGAGHSIFYYDFYGV